MDQNNIYLFGPFRLNTSTQLLCNEKSCFNLQPKVYRLLLYFLWHPGRVISHEELFTSVWDGRLVDDSALRLAVYSLRKVLRDQREAPDYIATICKRGYRFLAEVTVNDRSATAKSSEISPILYRPNCLQLTAEREYSQELAELQEAFQQASNGKRRLVFLQGEQSAGKTTMLETFLSKVQHFVPSVLRARSVRMGCVAEPFLPLLEALERHCRESHGRLFIERLNTVAPTWLYQMLNLLEPEEISMLQQKVSHFSTGRMLREGAVLFETLSNNATFILILDNAHWCDEFTLDLINFLMFRCSQAKILIIVSYRPNVNGPATRRIEEMQVELFNRGLCQELSMQMRLS